MVASTRKREAVDEAGPSKAKMRKTGNGKKGGKESKTPSKANIAASEFQAKALPLHIAISHTPPSIDDKDNNDIKDSMPEGDTIEDIPRAPSDSGFISTATLLPRIFSTGSYGWSGNGKFLVELQNAEIGEDGKRETVQVMLTVNATVIGSKGSGKTKVMEEEGKEEQAAGVAGKQEHIVDVAEKEDSAEAEAAQADAGSGKD